MNHHNYLDSSFYQVKRSYHCLKQKYKFRERANQLAKLLLVIIGIWIFSSLLIMLSQFESNRAKFNGHFMGNYWEYFWSSIIYLTSGFDYDPQLNGFSRLISVFVLLAGIIMVALLTGQIVSMFYEVLQRSEFIQEKPYGFNFRYPILICGINSKLNNIITLIRHNAPEKEIIIVDDHADEIKIFDKKLFANVWYYKGDPGDRDILKNIIGDNVCTAIILSSDKNKGNSNSDSRAIEIALAIEAFDDNVHTIIEINNRVNQSLLEITKIDEWISTTDFEERFLAQCAMKNFSLTMVNHLLPMKVASHQKQQIYILPISSNMSGRPFSEIKSRLESTDIGIILLGFKKYLPEQYDNPGFLTDNSNYITQINPKSYSPPHPDFCYYNTDNLNYCIHKEDKYCFFTIAQKLYFNNTHSDMLIFISHAQIDFSKLAFG